jgi:tetratricopeptide (TPR) repeat protein
MPLTINHLAQAGDALHRAGRADLAADFWDAAIAASPDDPALLTAAGVTFRAMRQPDRAEEMLRRAIAIEPTARRHVILGCSIHDQLRFEECEAEMRQARELAPNSADAAGLLGIWLLERWHWRDTSDDVLSEAIAHIERGIELAPDNYNFLSTRLAAMIAADRLDDVITEATRLLARYPNWVELHLHRAAARMKLGHLIAGYAEFGEWAYKLPRLAGHPFHTHPQWSPCGEAPNPKNQLSTGRTKSQNTNSKSGNGPAHWGIADLDLGSSSPRGEVFVWNVEGAGDHFQFIRYARALADDGWTVRAICNRTMDRLIAHVPGVATVVGEDEEIPEGATLAALPSLPAAYVGLAPLWSGPYMTADPATVAQWRERILGASDCGFGAHSLRVGVAWRGNPKQANDERRSFDVQRFRPLATMSGVSLVSLQHGHRDELAAFNRGTWSVEGGAQSSDPVAPRATPHPPLIADLGDDYEAGDWLDTAGVIANLDLVITPCTAVAHLAGAMGKPVWLALSEPGCWRWMQDRTDSPWYPSMRIFRQAVRGSWEGVFEAMAAALPGQQPKGRVDRSLTGSTI